MRVFVFSVGDYETKELIAIQNFSVFDDIEKTKVFCRRFFDTIHELISYDLVIYPVALLDSDGSVLSSGFCDDFFVTKETGFDDFWDSVLKFLARCGETVKEA